MAGLSDTDIMLDSSWQLTQAANGDAPLVSGTDCLLQDIRLEAMTQEGELFYDETWGWSMLDFLHSVFDELTQLAIEQRVKTKLSRRDEIDASSIVVTLSITDDTVTVKVTFSLSDDSDDTEYNLDVVLDRINVEVTTT